MSRRASAWLAWSVCAVSLLLMGFSLLMIFVGWVVPLASVWDPWSSYSVETVGYIGAPILGGLIASRRPETPYGWLWLGFGLSLALLTFGGTYAEYVLATESDSLPAPLMIREVGESVGFTGAVTLMPFLLLLFPDGRLPSGHWRFLAGAIASAGAVLLIIGPLQNDQSEFAPYKDPIAVGGAAGEAVLVLIVGGVLILFGAIALSALSLVLRYRSAVGAERQQIKWFAYAAVLFSGYLFLSFYPLPLLLSDLLSSMTFTGLCIAVGVAILKYRLYDIDLIINRTLVYGPLTATLAAVYFGGIVVLQRLFVVLTGEQSTLAIVASTLLIAALFNPLRRRIQGFIDRRFYCRKYDAAKTLEAFGSRLRDQTNLDALSNDMVRVAEATVQPAHVSLWLRPEPKPEARGAALRQFGQDE